jgi:hypothetical protein
MSTLVEHSANASVTIEYKGKIKYGRIPHWIREKQLESYYNSMETFYSECLEDLILPKRFDKKELHEILMESLRNFMQHDKDFTGLVTKLIENYPTFPMDAKTAFEYIIALKNLNARVALVGHKSNEELGWDALRSDLPFVIFSNLCLSNYTISYFHEYKAKATQQHFRHNYLLTRGRSNLRARKSAIDNYFQMMKPAEDLFKTLLKTQLKLWLFITLSNSENAKEFLEAPQSLRADKMDKEYLEKLKVEHESVLEKMRYQLYNVEPTLFNPIDLHRPTETMWKDMVLVRITQ